MAYFLKKVNRNGKVYLSIVDSFYDGSRGHTVHKTHSSYGTGEKLKTELGIDDPIAYLQSQVEKLNNEVLSNKEKGYISKMVNSRNRINEKIIFLHVSNTEEICDLMHSFLD